MNKKTQLGQFYTTNSQYIIGNLLTDIPSSLVVVEPFCGQGDLLIFNNEYEKPNPAISKTANEIMLVLPSFVLKNLLTCLKDIFCFCF